MLQQVFFDLCHKYTSNNMLIGRFWKEIEQAYSHKKRHYHTLQHLENMLHQLQEVKPRVDWSPILFALFYHDIVYNSLKTDNEEKSAIFAERNLDMLGVQKGSIQVTTNHIIATKKHLLSQSSDTNYFIDADLSILGFPWHDYKQYADGVRKEYSIYPDIIYKPGRKKVLQHFLQMESIYKTSHFKEKFENQAKQNLQQELDLY
jgi:predicted metal-dependent HD superfamily phosphohydrolase